jgi:hypothetical protein
MRSLWLFSSLSKNYLKKSGSASVQVDQRVFIKNRVLIKTGFVHLFCPLFYQYTFAAAGAAFSLGG